MESGRKYSKMNETGGKAFGEVKWTEEFKVS